MPLSDAKRTHVANDLEIPTEGAVAFWPSEGSTETLGHVGSKLKFTMWCTQNSSKCRVSAEKLPQARSDSCGAPALG